MKKLECTEWLKSRQFKCVLTASCFLTVDRLVQASTSSRTKARKDLEMNSHDFEAQACLLFALFFFFLSTCCPFLSLVSESCLRQEWKHQNSLAICDFSDVNYSPHPVNSILACLVWIDWNCCVSLRKMIWGWDLLNHHCKWDKSLQNVA